MLLVTVGSSPAPFWWNPQPWCSYVEVELYHALPAPSPRQVQIRSVKDAQRQNSCDGEKDLWKHSSLWSFERMIWGTCSLQFSRVLGNQACLAHRSDLDHALHFVFSFCLSLALLVPTLLFPRIISQINHLDVRPPRL